MSSPQTSWSRAALSVVFAEVLTLMAPLVGCKDEGAYAHIGVDLSLAGLDAKKRALVKQIVIRSSAEGATDSQATHEVSVTNAELDKSLAYHFDYIPAQQKGAFVVTATLAGDSEQLAIRSERVVVAAGKTVRAKIDFVSAVSTTGPCTPEAHPVDVGETESRTFTFLWDQDHYLYVYGDLTAGNGDLFSLQFDALGKRLSAPVSINKSARVSTLPSLAKLGDGFAVAWQEGDDADYLEVPVKVQLRHLDKKGAPVGNVREITTNANESRPQIIPAFGKLAMTWIDQRGPNDDPEHLALVTLLEPDDFSFSFGAPVTLRSPDATRIEDAFPGISLVGSILLASWVSEDKTVYSARVNDKLEVSPPVELHTSPFIAQQTWMVPAGDRFFSTWEDLSGDEATGRERIRGAYTALDGSPGVTDFLTAPLSGSANWPRGAYDGHRSVAVVYYQYRDFGSQIYLQRFTPEGERLDEPDVQITDVLGQAKYPNIQLARSDASGDHFAIGWVSDETGMPRVHFQAFVCK